MSKSVSPNRIKKLQDSKNTQVFRTIPYGNHGRSWDGGWATGAAAPSSVVQRVAKWVEKLML
jgi:hypothetical protein